MSSQEVQQSSSGGVKVGVQKFGRFLSGMVMPNIGAFIAWGIITTLFIPTGWFPNEDLATLVGPTITYLLPLLIGYTGGKMVHGTRGGVIGAMVTMGVILGSDITMFLGAMIVGPLAAWILKKFDQALEGKIPSGFEMLINNFSSGIIGAALSIGAYKGVGPLVTAFSNLISSGVEFLINHGLLPLANILIEPGKILFLNNAINHGILSPIGLEQSLATGKSIMFMLESNPGPGLGILLAYWLFGKGAAKGSAPGAIIIQFFGGIHEIYFPYVLMNPRLILAVIGGGMAGTFTFSLLGAGLTAAPSPGSILAYFALVPKGGYFAMISGVVIAAAVSFVIGALLLKTSKNAQGDIEEATTKMQDMKASSKGAETAGAQAGTVSAAAGTVKSKEDVSKIIFACDAGMGSSAMGASIMKKKVKAAGLPIQVTNTAINDLPSDADIVITHKSLTERARLKVPGAEHISIEDFLKSPEYDALINRLS
ncbi:PTS mannitol transporter subunit IICB [Paenibacillus sp. Leaf72]|uniref:PTS mannitol transporter subunit IICB n=1 Tax=Paenibacillus sp. Leaf72 TaxID=1736234 RepID=UPI0006F57086|nr:PTS mannitol transporter subunit IICBA [Paenibacillus sp. Leaf72]KQO17780.1 PTS mannitol transporter subunit IIBC [Paenibacillus sp. Leaf72]